MTTKSDTQTRTTIQVSRGWSATRGGRTKRLTLEWAGRTVVLDDELTRPGARRAIVDGGNPVVIECARYGGTPPYTALGQLHRRCPNASGDFGADEGGRFLAVVITLLAEEAQALDAIVRSNPKKS